MFVHVVLISFKPDTTEEDKNAVVQKLQDLGPKTEKFGILLWSIDKNIDNRSKPFIGGRSIDLVELAFYENEEQFQLWRNSPEHKEAGSFLGEYADWVIGDIRKMENLVA
jgi:hypothetical protein